MVKTPEEDKIFFYYYYFLKEFATSDFRIHTLPIAVNLPKWQFAICQITTQGFILYTKYRSLDTDTTSDTGTSTYLFHTNVFIHLQPIQYH